MKVVLMVILMGIIVSLLYIQDAHTKGTLTCIGIFIIAYITLGGRDDA